MRALAKSLHVSVITVQRAYEDLQRDGFIETTVGRGSFISANSKEFYQEEQQKRYRISFRRSSAESTQMWNLIRKADRTSEHIL